MAKIVLTLEDTTDDEGNPGMTVHWDADPKEDDGGTAFHYSAAFLEFILSTAGSAAIIDDIIDPKPPTETDTNLN